MHPADTSNRTAALRYWATVGKEANKLEAVEAGLEHDPEAVYTEYQHPERDPWRTVALPVLRDLLAGRALPREKMAGVLTRIALATKAPAALPHLE